MSQEEQSERAGADRKGLARHGWSSFAQGLSALRKVTLGDLSYYGDEEHYDFLVSRGLTSARAILTTEAGVVVDRNTDKSVIRMDGPTSAIYVKRFSERRLSHFLKRVFSQRLHSLARLEVENILWLRERGIATADLLFWGHTRALGVDGAFSFVGLRELAGFRELRFDPRPEAMASSCMVLIQMFREGFYWPDAKAKHFLNSLECKETAVIDLHGGRRRGALGGADLKKMVRTFLASFPPGDERHRSGGRRQLEELALGEITERHLRARLFRVLQGL
jgi:hypothetical protein